VVVPYALRNNDILLSEGRNYSPSLFLEQINFELDQLYAEGATRRVMMSVSARSHSGVALTRKDVIARYALSSPITLRETDTI